MTGMKARRLMQRTKNKSKTKKVRTLKDSGCRTSSAIGPIVAAADSAGRSPIDAAKYHRHSQAVAAVS
jgi:hypothetical protein